MNGLSEKVKLIRLTWCGNAGLLRSKNVHIGSFSPQVAQTGISVTAAIQGLTCVADVLAANCGITSSEDMCMVPDMPTLKTLPHSSSHAMVLVCFRNFDGTPSKLCPRTAARMQVQKLERMGYDVYCGFENEFNLLNRNSINGREFSPVDQTLYCSTSALNISEIVLAEIMEAITKIGEKIWLVHAESSSGQFEVTLKKKKAMDGADAQLFLREIIKGVAIKHDKIASFLPKLYPDQAGNGCHLHLSLCNKETNRSLFESKEATSISELLRQTDLHFFIAGILYHLPAIMAISCASTNSYRRLSKGCWAGVYQCWGVDNKEAAIRIPRDPSSESGFTNFEIKTVDATGNPHLVLTAILAAGIDGVEKKIELPEPIQVDPGCLSQQALDTRGINRLPNTLGEALGALEQDQALTKAIGKEQTQAFIAVKRAEIAEFSSYSHEDEVKFLIDRY